MVSFILPGNSATGGYEVANSCRFNAGSSDSLTRTFGTPTNNRIWTYSFWMKHIDNQGVFLNTGADTSYMYFRGSSANPVPFGFSVEQYVSSFQYKLIPNEVFRDHSAWQHIVIAFDTTQSTASNRVKIYKNGSQITSFNSEDYPSQNLDTQVNSAIAHKIGGFASSGFYDGYLAEVVFIDGQQLAPTSFGEFDEDSPNIWKPIDVSGLTFGNNGFYLDFEDSSSLGNDAAGSNNFTVNNLTSIDQSTDTCTNNFATLNPLTIVAGASLTLSEGNLTFNGTSTDAGAKATFGVSSGKWYWEVKTKLSDDNSSGSDRILVATENVRQITSATDPNSQGIWGIQSRSGSGATLNSFTNGTFSNGNSGSTGFNNGTIIGVALDADNGKLYFHKDGTYTDLSGNTGDPANGTNPTFTGLPTDGTFLFPYFENRPNVTPSSQVNFGGTQSFSISSGNSDGNGYGNFEYSVPSGYYALNTKNLAEYG